LQNLLPLESLAFCNYFDAILSGSIDCKYSGVFSIALLVVTGFPAIQKVEFCSLAVRGSDFGRE